MTMQFDAKVLTALATVNLSWNMPGQDSSQAQVAQTAINKPQQPQLRDFLPPDMAQCVAAAAGEEAATALLTSLQAAKNGSPIGVNSNAVRSYLINASAEARPTILNASLQMGGSALQEGMQAFFTCVDMYQQAKLENNSTAQHKTAGDAVASLGAVTEQMNTAIRQGYTTVVQQQAVQNKQPIQIA